MANLLIITLEILASSETLPRSVFNCVHRAYQLGLLTFEEKEELYTWVDTHYNEARIYLSSFGVTP